MSTNPFANSKAALVFAATTIIGALVIASTLDGEEALDDRLARVTEEREVVTEDARDLSEQPSEVIEPLDPASGWGGTGADVFGEYAAEEATEAEEEEAPQPWQASGQQGRSAASKAKIGGPVKADSPGMLVPRDDGSDQQTIEPY
ncbi:hypothetical protein [Erythrobacter dokdonensis]|uniref:Uncharacterized protein n=1 Tax=Erythrobacter dokdonensis DSW-74 TaxID=1300349 RepID=A0A1A7BEV3_9SPHN|nr:hypothetical protein [Erythrobacter dokdonensis]OBV09917.1 hypothetical protein I603_2813 [Erythrobacter dokdonensis DSW-74]